jgi:SHS family lactate transporter-like MFS transporter
MQAGYPVGYLLAAVVMQTLTPSLGWRIAFFVGLPVAILIVILSSLAQESGAWKKHHGRSGTSVFRSMLANRSIFAYLLLMMTVLMFLSHGSQDLYPDFLHTIRAVSSKSILGMDAELGIPVLFNVGAIAGAYLRQCLLYTYPSPPDRSLSRMPSSA